MIPAISATRSCHQLVAQDHSIN